MAAEQYDGMLLNIAQRHDGIAPLLDTFFSFLQRKTDFFTGGEPGAARKVVLNVLDKYASEAERVALSKREAAAKIDVKARKQEARRKEKQAEVQKAKDAERAAKKAKGDDGGATAGAAAGGAPSIVECDEDGNEIGADGKAVAAVESGEAKAAEAGAGGEGGAADAGEGKGEGEDAEEEEEDKGPKLKGNGGETEGYTWTQTLKEVNVLVPIPSGTRGKHMDIVMKKDRLKVCVKGAEAIMNGNLHKVRMWERGGGGGGSCSRRGRGRRGHVCGTWLMPPPPPPPAPHGSCGASTPLFIL